MRSGNGFSANLIVSDVDHDIEVRERPRDVRSNRPEVVSFEVPLGNDRDVVLVRYFVVAAEGEQLRFSDIDESVFGECREAWSMVEFNAGRGAGEFRFIQVEDPFAEKGEAVTELPDVGSLDEVSELRVPGFPFEILRCGEAFGGALCAVDDCGIDCQPIDLVPPPGSAAIRLQRGLDSGPNDSSGRQLIDKRVVHRKGVDIVV